MKIEIAKYMSGAFALCLTVSLPAQETRQEARGAQETYAEIEETLGQVPSFLRAYPESGIAGAWEAMKGVELNPDTALSAKQKELIALAVASRIPCDYCTYFHTAGAKGQGATEQEIQETLAIGAGVAHWSTILNGSQIDLEEFKRETDQIMEHLSEQPPVVFGARPEERTGNPTQAGSSEAQETYREIEQTLGLIPSFLRAYPEIGVAGAWEALKGVQLNPDTALSAKDKELIGLAVAAGIPCDYCTYFHTAGAKAHGVTEQEIGETLAMGAAVRHWSTILNGSQIDLEEFKRETDQIMDHLAERPAAGGN